VEVQGLHARTDKRKVVKEEMVDPTENIMEEAGAGIEAEDFLPVATFSTTVEVSARRVRRGRGKATPAVTDSQPTTLNSEE